ncbi:WD40 repeat-like protein [Suillus brevipes Sb2]|nr:WD40 repeat-like protein [Suillus brevipes Sb2]
MVTASNKTLRLWDLETGVVLKKMEGHSNWVNALAVSGDGQIIASNDMSGELIAWHGETTRASITQPITEDSDDSKIMTLITSVDFSPDGTVLATSSMDHMVKFWCTRTWQMQGESINYGTSVINCFRYSPSGELLAIATDDNIQIYDPGTKECIASVKGHTEFNLSLAWTPNGTRLLSAGDNDDPTIREWDPLTWQQVGHPWEGHTSDIYAIAIHPAGTLVASASHDKHVRLWRRSDQQTIAIFQHSFELTCVTFTVEGKHILSGGVSSNKISEWAVPKDANSKASFHSSFS